MSVVERENGSVSDSVVDGNLVLTVTVNGLYEVDADLLDRVLQFVLLELKVDTAWKVGEPMSAQPIEVPVPPLPEPEPPAEGPPAEINAYSPHPDHVCIDPRFAPETEQPVPAGEEEPLIH